MRAWVAAVEGCRRVAPKQTTRTCSLAYLEWSSGLGPELLLLLQLPLPRFRSLRAAPPQRRSKGLEQGAVCTPVVCGLGGVRVERRGQTDSGRPRKHMGKQSIIPRGPAKGFASAGRRRAPHAAKTTPWHRTRQLHTVSNTVWVVCARASGVWGALLEFQSAAASKRKQGGTELASSWGGRPASTRRPPGRPREMGALRFRSQPNAARTRRRPRFHDPIGKHHRAHRKPQRQKGDMWESCAKFC